MKYSHGLFRLSLIIVSLVFFVSLISSSCVPCHYEKGPKFQIDRIVINDVEYDNTDMVIWHDDLMCFDYLWVMEKLGFRVVYEDNIVLLYYNDKEYILDTDNLVLHENTEKESANVNYFANGAGWVFIGVINGKLYVNSVVLITSLMKFNIYYVVSTNVDRNLIILKKNPNYGDEI